MKDWLIDWMNEWTNERTNERTTERTMIELMNDRVDGNENKIPEKRKKEKKLNDRLLESSF